MRDAEKKRALGEEGWKEWQRVRYANRVKVDKRKQWSWLEDTGTSLFLTMAASRLDGTGGGGRRRANI